MPPLLAVPNVSEGRDPAVLGAIGDAFARGGARVLDAHTDPDHHRSVFTLTAPPRLLSQALVHGAHQAIERIDLSRHAGAHPRVGALDVAPVVYLEPEDRGVACAEAIVLADALGELGLPVYLYGELAGGRTRAELRRRGALDDLEPDAGPRTHPSAGATLVAARPPLIAFNVVLAPPATVEQARQTAAAIREGGADGLPGVRAIGLHLESSGAIQVSTNIEDHRGTTPAQVVEAVRRHAPVATAELVGLAPRAAFDGFPRDVPVANLRLIEDALNT